MIKINQKEAFELRKNGMESLVCMSGKTNKSKGKKYWVVENQKALKFLEKQRKSVTKEEK